jgi:hypothetical protein
MSIFLGGFVLGEQMTTLQWGLVFILFVASVFVTIDERLTFASFLNPSIGLAFALNTFLALYGLFINQALEVDRFWTVVFWVQLLTLFFMIPTVPLFWKDRKTVMLKHVFIIILIAFLTVIGVLAETAAFGDNIGLSSVIISLPLATIIAMVFSFVAPKLLEHHTPKIYAIRFAASICMMGAALILSTR